MWVPIIYSFFLRRRSFLLQVPKTHSLVTNSSFLHGRETEDMVRSEKKHSTWIHISGLIGRFLAWVQCCTNMASGNMGINPRSFICIGSYLDIKAFSVLLLLLPCIYLRFSKQLKITKSSLCKLEKCFKNTNKTNTETSRILIRNFSC